MRTLLIGLSLTATTLAMPALARQPNQVLVTEPSSDERFEVSPNDFAIDIFVPARPSEPVLQYAVIRYYNLSQPPVFRSTGYLDIVSEYPVFDPRLMPASQLRIKAFYDLRHEHLVTYRRFGELNYYWT